MIIYKNTSNNPFTLNLLEDTDKYFIHFDSSRDLELFLRKNNFSVGHTCCDGKGAHLIGVSSYGEINKLKQKFYESQFECLVCLDPKNTNNAYQMNCSHNICSTCVNTIKNKNNLQNNCPLCRVPFS